MSNAQVPIKKIIIRVQKGHVKILDVVLVTTDNKEVSAYDTKIPVKVESWHDVLIW